MVIRSVIRVVLLLSILAACAPAAVGRKDADATRPAELATLLAKADYTVVEFFSASCPCQRSHDARLNALAVEFAPAHVQFVAVDSEVTAGVDVDAAEQRARAYSFPLLSDPSGAWADALGATYATFTVVLNRGGQRLYRGGLDSDRHHLSDTTTPYLREALRALVKGDPPPRGEAKTLGCVLRRR